MGLFSWEKSLHMGSYFSNKNPYRWVPFWGLGVRTYFASIPREIIPEMGMIIYRRPLYMGSCLW